jgi:hypothetical protein
VEVRSGDTRGIMMRNLERWIFFRHRGKVRSRAASRGRQSGQARPRLVPGCSGGVRSTAAAGHRSMAARTVAAAIGARRGVSAGLIGGEELQSN